MTIVGFNFNKINVEKKNQIKSKVNISNNVSIRNIKKTDLSLGNAKQEGLKFEFVFTSRFDPEIGEIVLEGDVLMIEDKPKVKEILDSWKKNKKIPSETMTRVLNSVLSRCNIEALILSKEVNLPPPIPMPKVNVNPEKE